VITFDISEVPEFQRWLNSKLERGVRRGFHSAALRTVAHIQTVLIPREKRKPVDMGIYRAAWRVVIAKGSTPRVEIVNNAPHAPLIEYGVRAANVKPGRKMLDALTAWVKRKGISGGSQKVHPALKEDLPAKPPKERDVATSSGDVTAFPELKKLVRQLKKMIQAIRSATQRKGDVSVAPAVGDADAERIAWAIAMSMKKHGIFNEGKGLRIAQRARAVLVRQFIRAEVIRELQREFS